MRAYMLSCKGILLICSVPSPVRAAYLSIILAVCSAAFQSIVKVANIESWFSGGEDALLLLQVPEGVDWAALVKNAMDTYSVEIAGGLGPTVGKVSQIWQQTSGHIHGIWSRMHTDCFVESFILNLAAV